MRVAVAGLGAVGRSAAGQLAATEQVRRLTLVDPEPARIDAVAAALDAPDRVGCRPADLAAPGNAYAGHDVVVLASGGDLWPSAAAALAAGADVVAAVDDPVRARPLLGLEAEARERQRTVAVGACMAPGLTCVLAALLAAQLDRVAEIHVASFGTGGPACARRRHQALSSIVVDWREGAWRRYAGGSGRELVWFPEPVGGADCYRAAMADPMLLVPAFPKVRRVTARLAATRRDRMTAWLPMLRPPHPEGTVGAVRTEVRGWRHGVPEDRILGAVARPALAAGTVAALCATWAAEGRLAGHGAGGLGRLVADPGGFLSELAARGLRTVAFEGAAALETAAAHQLATQGLRRRLQS